MSSESIRKRKEPEGDSGRAGGETAMSEIRCSLSSARGSWHGVSQSREATRWEVRAC